MVVVRAVADSTQPIERSRRPRHMRRCPQVRAERVWLTALGDAVGQLEPCWSWSPVVVDRGGDPSQHRRQGCLLQRLVCHPEAMPMGW